MTLRLFVSGTDTDVGKTYIAAMLARAIVHRCGNGTVGVYKPVASGCWEDSGMMVSGDATELWNAAGCPLDLQRVCPQRFAAPLSPPRAAEAEGRTIDQQLLFDGIDAWQPEFPTLLIEGAGGLLSPLADGLLNVNFAERLGCEIILVAANRLGVINHTLSTVEVCRNRLGCDPLAVFLSQVTAEPCLSVTTNASELARYIDDIPIIEVDYGQSDFASLPQMENLLSHFDQA